MRWLTERRRRHLLETPFPDAWSDVLRANVPAYWLLDGDGRRRMRDLVQVFVVEKHWHGEDGLAITDEIRVTIAGTGCQLLLGTGDHDLFDDVRAIHVYPGDVAAAAPGVLAIAWNAALRGARDPHDGHNVVIRELARWLPFAAKAGMPVDELARATELFFERPGALRHESPDVYAQLAELYQLDLAAQRATR